MINRISFNTVPSFGMAKITETAKEAAEGFGVPANDFVDSALFKKPGAIAKKASTIEEYDTVCQQYGCNNNGTTNAAFIKTQILSPKGSSVAKKFNPDDVAQTYKKLFDANYDNPELKRPFTKALLNKAKAAMAPQEYTIAAGLLDGAK